MPRNLAHEVDNKIAYGSRDRVYALIAPTLEIAMQMRERMLNALLEVNGTPERRWAEGGMICGFEWEKVIAVQKQPWIPAKSEMDIEPFFESEIKTIRFTAKTYMYYPRSINDGQEKPTDVVMYISLDNVEFNKRVFGWYERMVEYRIIPENAKTWSMSG